MPLEAQLFDETEGDFLQKFKFLDRQLLQLEKEVDDDPSKYTLLRFFNFTKQIEVSGIKDADGEIVPDFYKTFFERLQRLEIKLKEKLGESVVEQIRKNVGKIFQEPKKRIPKNAGLAKSVSPSTAKEKNRRRGDNRVGLSPADRKKKRRQKKKN